MMEPDATLHVDKAEYERLQREAAHHCGPHTCSRSRRWKVVAVFALVVLVGMMLDKCYREEARNEAFTATLTQSVQRMVEERVAQQVPGLVASAVPDMSSYLQLVADLTALRDTLRRQVWVAATPEPTRDEELLRRVEALEHQ